MGLVEGWWHKGAVGCGGVRWGAVGCGGVRWGAVGCVRLMLSTCTFSSALISLATSLPFSRVAMLLLEE